MRRGGRPVPAATRSLGGHGQRRTEHRSIRAAGDGFRQCAGRGDVTVGDDVHVASTGLVQVVPTCGRRVGDRSGHRNTDAEHLTGGGAAFDGAVAHDDAGRTRAHQVQRSPVIADAAGDDGDVELCDERLEVERLVVAVRNVLGGDDRALDDQQIQTRRDQSRRQSTGVLRAHSYSDGDACITHLAHCGGQQIGLQRRSVQFLQECDRCVGIEIGLGDVDQLIELGLHVGVPRPQPFTVDHPEPALLTELDGERRRDQRVGRMGEHRDVEPVSVELPGSRHLLGRPGPPRRHDIDVVQLVGAAGFSAHADFNEVAHARTFLLRERIVRPPGADATIGWCSSEPQRSS